MLTEEDHPPNATEHANDAPFQNPMLANQLEQWLQKHPLPNSEENAPPQNTAATPTLTRPQNTPIHLIV
jgi:hypothetical protein